MLKTTIAAAFVMALSLGIAGTASAAPFGHTAANGAQVASPALVEAAHWEWRHYHRVWAPDHRRGHRYGS